MRNLPLHYDYSIWRRRKRYSGRQDPNWSCGNLVSAKEGRPKMGGCMPGWGICWGRYGYGSNPHLAWHREDRRCIRDLCPIKRGWQGRYGMDMVAIRTQIGSPLFHAV
jgi:hypothetical protein